ncbi:MAG: SDR family oxidoreductase [Gammaproteobacteria bacterium AqS3]|nr:SDR family oxidoreductase [Gammaproteobacteria bacterium AqS3]
MDLGLTGRKALVCASSRGLGYACAEALVREGADIVINGRDAEKLEQAASQLGRLGGGTVKAVCADVGTEAGLDALCTACPEPDILINNNGGPPPGHYRDWDEPVWNQALHGNMLTPILLIRRVIDGMRERRFGRIVNITSALVKSPTPSMGLSTAARAGLTGFTKGLSREVARENVTVNNLLPGRFETDRLRQLMEFTMQARGLSYEDVRTEMEAEIPAARLGELSEFGDTCAFLCSVQAGYISGQNILLDGGSHGGLL